MPKGPAYDRAALVTRESIEQNWFIYARLCDSISTGEKKCWCSQNMLDMKLSWLSQVNQLPLTNEFFKSGIIHKFSSFTDAKY